MIVIYHLYIILCAFFVLHFYFFQGCKGKAQWGLQGQIQGWQHHIETFSHPYLPPGAQMRGSQGPEQALSSASSPQPLDYESCDQYDLKVVVQNEAPLLAAAPRAQRDQARVSVQVQDVNEAPVFQENPLRTSLAEGAAPGTPVATFLARDPDTQHLQRLRCPPGALGLRQRELIAPFPHFPARTRSTAESTPACVPWGVLSGPWSKGGGLICLYVSLMVQGVSGPMSANIGVILFHVQDWAPVGTY